MPRRHDERGRRASASSARSPRARVPAAACTPPTPWPRSRRRSGSQPAGLGRHRPSADRRRDYYAHRSGEAVVNLLQHGHHRPATSSPRRRSRTRSPSAMALGGSTNVVLHLLAIAREAEVELNLHDFNRIGDKVPHIADMKPFGKYVMNDVDRHGGIPVHHEGDARRGPAARRRAHGHRQDARREPRRPGPRPDRRRGPAHRSTTRSTRPAASRSCTARSRPRARS